ncbi:MAG: tetratricopeptide repeat protein [Gammaproteobacteria bacterium]|nr:tetratricopeptide repeat protein [Gammaproteobacteria bacterium]
METYKTDEEQIEAVKQWWKENGLPIVLGLVIGLGGIFGWRGWQAWEQSQAQAASEIYQDLINDMREKNADGVRKGAQQLLNDYPSTAYAVYAALNLASLAVQESEFETARKHLEYARDHATGRELRLLAELRLARVMVAEGNEDEALALISGRDFGALSGIADELRGDILASKGDRQAAMEAYSSALAMASPDSEEYELLSLKRDSVSLSAN